MTSARRIRSRRPRRDRCPSIFDDTTYKKGAFVLRMLEHSLGEAKMAALLRGWFDRHGAGAAVETDDLMRELSDASGRDLRAFFDGFVRGAYHPELDVTLTAGDRGTDVKVTQVQKDTLYVRFAAGSSRHLCADRNAFGPVVPVG